MSKDVTAAAKKKGGRPRIQIDQELFETLCGLQCTLPEIADALKCSPDTVERWCVRTYKMTFSEVFAEKRQAGLISLRRAQFRLAQSNAGMAIFLGKQLLGQSDDPRKYEREASTEEKIDGFIGRLEEVIQGGGQSGEGL